MQRNVYQHTNCLGIDLCEEDEEDVDDDDDD
jgi:hypothetical protein